MAARHQLIGTAGCRSVLIFLLVYVLYELYCTFLTSNFTVGVIRFNLPVLYVYVFIV